MPEKLWLIVAGAALPPFVLFLFMLWTEQRRVRRPAAGPAPSAWELLQTDLRFREAVRRRYGWDGRVYHVPSAEETRASLERFREAIERSDMLDLIWERYSQGRGLFLDELRAVISRSRRGRAKRPSPSRYL